MKTSNEQIKNRKKKLGDNQQRQTTDDNFENMETKKRPNMSTQMSISVVQRHLMTIEKLRARVHQVLKCVINLHIDILVLESNVNQLLDEVKEINADLEEVQRLDTLINTLRDYRGPTICHEWPYPLIFEGAIEQADLAQILNSKHSIATKAKILNENNLKASGKKNLKT